MRLSAAAFPALILACIALTGCGRVAPGIIIGDDGSMLSATDANIRLTTVNTIERQLDAQLGGHWRCQAVISELPVYGPHERGSDDGWIWPKLTATVTLIGDGAGASLLSEAQVSEAVVEYLSSKVERPASRHLIVTVASVTDAARFAARNGATPVPPPAPAAVPAQTPAVAPAVVLTPPATTAPAAIPVALVPAPVPSQPVPVISTAPVAPPRPAPIAPVPTAGSTSAAERALAPGELRYTVQAGDSLAELSVAFYGTPDHWRRIADANPGTAGGLLKPGTVIVIPAKP